jgi:ABC-2 type transport system permease protein
MTAQTLSRPAARTNVARLTTGGVVRAEWTKFRSLRSMWLTVLASVVLVVGVGALISAVQASHYTVGQPTDFLDPVTSPLSGVILAQLSVGVLGVLLASGECATGMIRSTLTAVPKRLPVLWAKLSVFSAVTLVVSVVSTFAVFLAGQAFFATKHLDVSITSAGALRSVVGAALYLVLIGVIGLALGSLLRNTAAAISSLVGLLFVLPPVLGALPASWTDHFAQYLPASAGQALWNHPMGTHAAPWVGFAVLCLWAAAAVAGAALALARRDA